jgi:hypothetical protein
MSDGDVQSQVITCMMVEFSPVQGPRVKQRFEPSPGALDTDKKEWLVQFITKDLLHLQQEHRDYLDSSASRHSSGHLSASANTLGSGVGAVTTSGNDADGGGPIGANGTGAGNEFEENQFVKVVCLDQLNVVVLVIFFSVSNDDATSDHSGGNSKVPPPSMYAVAIVLFNVSTLRLRAALPTIRDRLFYTHQEILYAEKDEIDIEKDWGEKLREISPMIDRWLSARVDRQKLALYQTVLLPNGRLQLQTLCSFLTCAMSFHRCVIRADSPQLVSKWLNTIALFLPDDRLLFACVTSKEFIIPDLTLQGTTMQLDEIIKQVPLFRQPPVILDVSRALNEPAHYFPTVTITVFSEVREKIFRGAAVVGEISSSRTRPTTVKPSTLISTVCHRVYQILNPPSARSQVLSGGDGPIILTPSRALHVHGAPRSSSVDTGPISITPAPPSNPDDDPLSFMVNKSVLIAIDLWRRQLALRAFAFYVVEMELKRDRAVNITAQAGLKTQEADHLVLQTAVDYVAQVQQVRERIVRTVLMETFIF